MKKTYFITLQQNRKSDGGLQFKTFFYHKPFKMSKRKMISELYDKYSDWSFKDIKRVK